MRNPGLTGLTGLQGRIYLLRTGARTSIAHGHTEERNLHGVRESGHVRGQTLLRHASQSTLLSVLHLPASPPQCRSESAAALVECALLLHRGLAAPRTLSPRHLACTKPPRTKIMPQAQWTFPWCSKKGVFAEAETACAVPPKPLHSLCLLIFFNALIRCASPKVPGAPGSCRGVAGAALCSKANVQKSAPRG